MRKWIRFPGLAVFVMILLFLGITWFLLVDSMIEWAIEKTGTRIVGAKVELSDADLSLFPLGLTLRGLQVTNPNKPMSNAVEVGRIAFNVDTSHLFLRKVIIDEMSVENVQFDTPRTSSGAVIRKAQKKKGTEKSAAFKMPSFEMPDVKEILKKENLSSLQDIDKLRTDVKAAREKWERNLEALPDRKALNEFKERIDKLQKKKSGDLTGAIGSVGEVVKIQEELTQTIKRIETAQKDFGKDMQLLKRRMNEVQNAPQKDIARIMNKYSLTPEGLSNMSRILFGPKISSIIHTALVWHEKLKPIMERNKSKSNNTEVVKPVRGKGVNVRFPETEAIPDFLVREMKVSVKLDMGELTGKIMNVTPDQDVLGKPTEFSFSGKELKKVDSISLSGTLNHVIPEKAKDTLNVAIKGLKFNDVSITEKGELPVSLEKGTAFVTADSTLAGKAISSAIRANLTNLTISTTGIEPSHAVAKVLASTLKDISHIELSAHISGAPDQYDMKITSNLDQVLSNAIGQKIKKQARAFEDQLKKEIMAEVESPMGELKSSFSGLNGIDKEINKRLDFGNKIFQDSGKGAAGGLKLPF